MKTKNKALAYWRRIKMSLLQEYDIAADRDDCNAMDRLLAVIDDLDSLKLAIEDY